jgi:uncharacterized protein YbaP (TraB family)
MNKAVRTAWLAMLVAVARPVCAEAVNDCPPPTQPPSPEMIQAAARTARDHGFLWRVAKDGRTSYLYGTIHVGKLDWAIPGPSVAAALQASDTVALELDMLDPQIQQDLAAAVANMKASPMPADLMQRLRAASIRECLTYDAIAKLSPEFQIITLTLADARREGLDAGYATDVVLAGAGHAAGKAVVSLETVESQMRLLQSANAQEAAETVKDGLDQLEGGAMRAVLKRLARVWADPITQT